MAVESYFKQYIDDRGIKQKFICDKTGFAPSTISAIYKGHLPSIETALVLAKFFGVLVEDLWKVKEN
jgi:putative transcriptional regulator